MIVCGPYPNQTYIYYFPAGLYKVIARVPVECNCLLTSIDCFDWSKIYFKFFTQAYFCWLLICVYCIDWIGVNWSCNLSLGVIENCLLDVFIPDIWVFFPRRLVEGPVKGAGFVVTHVIISWLNDLKAIISRFW